MAAPLTEVITDYGVKDAPEGAIKVFLKTLEKSKGCLGVCRGDVVEGLEGKKGVQLVVGWESTEAHVEAMKQEDVPSVVGPAVACMERIEVFHAKFGKA